MPVLFWSLDTETRARLMQVQYDHFGTELTIPGLPEALSPRPEEVKPVLEEDLYEIDKIMRQPPSRSHDRGEDAE